VHTILQHVARHTDIDVEKLYEQFGWPLYAKYGHCIEAFKRAVTDPESVFAEFNLEPQIYEPLVKEIRRRLTPQKSASLPCLSTLNSEAPPPPYYVRNVRRTQIVFLVVKIRADVELTCFEYDGVEAIKEGIRAGLTRSSDEFPLTIQLTASPQYVLYTHTMDKEGGIALVTEAIEAIRAAIEAKGGVLKVKHEPRAVNEVEEKKTLPELMDEDSDYSTDED
jgi:translation initiation factor 2 subunit 1